MVKPWVAIQVIYALPQEIITIDCEVPAGSTVVQAIHLSGLMQRVPDLQLKEGTIGIYSQKVPLNHIITAGDRIEFYRPVTADPKRVRRHRIEKKRQKNL